jgi:uncharacterized membrane protein
MMVKVLASFGAAFACMVGIDMIWLSTMSPRLYQPHLSHLLAGTVSLAPAGLFYLVYVAGIVGLATLPAGRGGGALLRGALLGFVAYGTYDLTNQATLRDWPTVVTLADMAWGTALTSISAYAGFCASSGAGRSR